jgi:hypothetical protein
MAADREAQPDIDRGVAVRGGERSTLSGTEVVET